MIALLQWHKVYKFSEDELHRPPVVALSNGTISLRIDLFGRSFKGGRGDYKCFGPAFCALAKMVVAGDVVMFTV